MAKKSEVSNADGAILVDGLKELRSALQDMNKDLPRELNKALREVSKQTADDARSRAESAGSTLAHIAPSIKGGFSGNRGFVKFGGAKFPEAGGAEFGGGLYGKGHPNSRGGYTTQFRPWRGNGEGAGYAIFPAIRARREQNKKLVEEAIRDFIKRKGLD